MSKPTEGTVLEPYIPADVSECSLEDACKKITDAGNIPRRLTVGNDDVRIVGQSELADKARKFGLVLSVNGDFAFGEWTVDDLVKNGFIYWNAGIGQEA